MTSPNFIALLDLTTSADDRPLALAQLDRERPLVTAMPGCVGFRVFVDRTNEATITVVHEWQDRTSFDGYLDSDAFRRSGEVLRPLLTCSPTSRRFRVEAIETVV